MNLEEKIVSLFELRKIPELLALATEDKSLRKRLLVRLKRLQQVIYDLDHFLESNWDIDPQVLNHHWENIYQSLKGFHVRGAQIATQIAHIKKYQTHELQLRERKLPTRLSMDYFYFYKSCDVKLMRSLIYHSFPKMKNFSSLSDWRCFDLLTEIQDDIEDLYEDTATINGNRFLIQLITDGEDKTYQVYSDFIDVVNIKCKERFKDEANHKSLRDKINRWTMYSVSELRDLLKDQLINYKASQFATPILASYIPELNIKLGMQHV